MCKNCGQYEVLVNAYYLEVFRAHRDPYSAHKHNQPVFRRGAACRYSKHLATKPARADGKDAGFSKDDPQAWVEGTLGISLEARDTAHWISKFNTLSRRSLQLP